MPFCHVNDLRMHYQIHGQGPPLLLIMGLSGDLTWWDRLVPELERHFKLITFDNRGAGLTDKPEDRYSIAMFAHDTVGLMDALKIRHAHVFGVSMGGMIAQELISRYPDRVDRLALGCTHSGGPAFIMPSAEAVQNMVLTRGKSLEEIAKQTISILFSPYFQRKDPEYVATMTQRFVNNPPSKKAFTNQFWAVIGHNCYDRLPSIDKPTLIITGDADVLVPPENSRVLKERIPASHMVIIPRAGHAFFSEAPRETAQYLVDHFSGG